MQDFGPLMSALGHKRTFAVQNGMSALAPIADICSAQADIRFVPIADIDRDKRGRMRVLIRVIRGSSCENQERDYRCAESIRGLSLSYARIPFVTDEVTE